MIMSFVAPSSTLCMHVLFILALCKRRLFSHLLSGREEEAEEKSGINIQ